MKTLIKLTLAIIITFLFVAGLSLTLGTVSESKAALTEKAQTVCNANVNTQYVKLAGSLKVYQCKK